MLLALSDPQLATLTHVDIEEFLPPFSDLFWVVFVDNVTINKKSASSMRACPQLEPNLTPPAILGLGTVDSLL